MTTVDGNRGQTRIRKRTLKKMSTLREGAQPQRERERTASKSRGNSRLRAWNGRSFSLQSNEERGLRARRRSKIGQKIGVPRKHREDPRNGSISVKKAAFLKRCICWKREGRQNKKESPQEGKGRVVSAGEEPDKDET